MNWALRELKQVLPAPLLMSAKGEIAGSSRGTTKLESMSKTKTIITARNWYFYISTKKSIIAIYKVDDIIVNLSDIICIIKSIF